MENYLIQTEPLSEYVAGKITEIIKDRGLQRGDQVPTETELIEMLGVGRSSVREAVKSLVSRGMLEIRRGRGTFLCQNPALPDDPLGLSFAPDQVKAYRDLLAVRMELEPWVAAEAAKHAGEDDIRKILRLCDEVERQIRAGVDHMDKDMEFHTAIAESTGNEVVMAIFPYICKSVSVFIEMSRNALRQETIETHRTVAEAIARHDSAAAEEAMRLHIRYNERAIGIDA